MGDFDAWQCPVCGSHNTDSCCNEEFSEDSTTLQEEWECFNCGCHYVNQYKVTPDVQFIKAPPKYPMD